MTPADAPACVDVKLFGRPRPTAAWAAWLAANPTGTYWECRRVIRPRLILIHTNAGPTPANRDQIASYAMQAQDNTKPTYQVDRDGHAYKFLPSDRQGIANYLADPFSISIETGDLGSTNGIGGFTPEQVETIAQIVAFEAQLWSIPIETPGQWNGEGVASHTDPFTYPYWTKYQGKICPGPQKKLEVRQLIMPRARAILNAPTPIPQEDEPMQQIRVADDPAVFLRDGLVCTWIADEGVQASLVAAGIIPTTPVKIVDRACYAAFELHGQLPNAGPTVATDFAAWIP